MVICGRAIVASYCLRITDYDLPFIINCNCSGLERKDKDYGEAKASEWR